LIAVASSSISANNVGRFVLFGPFITSGISVGSVYYISPTTAGGITTTVPTTSGQQVRIVGYGLTSNILFIKPSDVYLEIA